AALRWREGAPPLNIFLCENQLRCSDLLRGLVEQHLSESERSALERLALIETVVARMVPVVPEAEGASDPLLALAEDYHRLPGRRGAPGEPLPEVPGVEWVEEIVPVVEQNLYGHNMAHAVAAYLGYRRGRTFIHAALADPQVAPAVEGALAETGEALCRK